MSTGQRLTTHPATAKTNSAADLSHYGIYSAQFPVARNPRRLQNLKFYFNMPASQLAFPAPLFLATSGTVLLFPAYSVRSTALCGTRTVHAFAPSLSFSVICQLRTEIPGGRGRAYLITLPYQNGTAPNQVALSSVRQKYRPCARESSPFS